MKASKNILHMNEARSVEQNVKLVKTVMRFRKTSILISSYLLLIVC